MNYKNKLLNQLCEAIERTRNYDKEIFNILINISANVSKFNECEIFLCKYENDIYDALDMISRKHGYYRYTHKDERRKDKYIYEQFLCLFCNLRSENKELNIAQIKYFIDNGVTVNNINVLSKQKSNNIRDKFVQEYMQGVPEFTYYNTGPSPARHQCANCKPLREKEGYYWHAFNNKYFPCKDVESNYLKLMDIKEKELIFMWEFCGGLSVEVSTDIAKKIDYEQYHDIYIYPRNLQWTFACTHENDYIFADKRLMNK